VTLYHTKDSYAEANFGIRWVEELLVTHKREGLWNLVVDADELLVLEEKWKNLYEFCTHLEERGRDALGTILVDLYGSRAIKDTPLLPGEKMLQECHWSDRHLYTTYSPSGGPGGLAPLYHGGARSRTFGIDTVVLNKYPLFRFRSDVMRLREGMHWIEGASPFYGHSLLLHFKYIASFHDYAEREVKRGEHWNGASEYKKYHSALQRNPEFSLYDRDFSVFFDNIASFVQRFPFMWSSKKNWNKNSEMDKNI